MISIQSLIYNHKVVNTLCRLKQEPQTIHTYIELFIENIPTFVNSKNCGTMGTQNFALLYLPTPETMGSWIPKSMFFHIFRF